ncbi:MAG TPA: hypothetical protein VFM70_06795, partial [Salinimicrobium sp.]|nr:hypothetical protein [Salinimicrobium sp.]
SNFKKHLQEKLKNHNKPRPFICEGNPLDCKIFIVGINAATEMQQDFWEFWSEEDGFNKNKWLGSYKAERAAQPLKKGKTRRNTVSNTRKRIDWIVEATKPVKILETNLFVKATPTAKELKAGDRRSEVFEYLLETIKPEVIFLHENQTIKYFEKLDGVKIVKNETKSFEILGTKTKVLAKNHLSRGWSEANTKELGKDLKAGIRN